MGTRATYQFQATNFAPSQTFYIHWDGYPEGAAVYFEAMLKCENSRSGLAGQFFRANELAEFTESHKLHADTEYRYNISYDGNGEAVVEMLKRVDFGDTWERSLPMPIEQFIEMYNV